MIDHMVLFRAIRRLNPKHLVIDTVISSQPGAIIEVWEEAIDVESAAAFGESGSPGPAFKGLATKSALEMMLKAAGFGEIRYWNWKKAGIKCWADLQGLLPRRAGDDPMHDDEEVSRITHWTAGVMINQRRGSALGSIWQIATKRDPGQPWVPTTEVGREAGYARVLRVQWMVWGRWNGPPATREQYV